MRKQILLVMIVISLMIIPSFMAVRLIFGYDDCREPCECYNDPSRKCVWAGGTYDGVVPILPAIDKFKINCIKKSDGTSCMKDGVPMYVEAEPCPGKDENGKYWWKVPEYGHDLGQFMPGASDVEGWPNWDAIGNYEISICAIGCVDQESEDAVCVVTPVACDGINGDANDDGEVNIADIITILEYLYNPGSTSTARICADNADVNGDGYVDIADVQALAEMIGLIH